MESRVRENAKIADENNMNYIFYAKRIIHHEFVPEKQTVNGKFHKEVIKKLVARVHRVRPEFQESGSWYLLHCTALHRRILRASSPRFCRNEGSLCYPTDPVPLIYRRLTFFIS
jgi:hypothetical protein